MHPLDESLARVRALSPYFQITKTDTPCGITIAQLSDLDGDVWRRLYHVQHAELGDVSPNMLIGAVLQTYTWPVLSGSIACYLITQRVPILEPQWTSVPVKNEYPEALELQSRRFFCVAHDACATHPDAVVLADHGALRQALRQQITLHFAPLIDAICQRTRLSASSLWVRVADASAGVVVRVCDMRGDMPPDEILHEAQALVGDSDALLYCRRVATTVIPHRPYDRVFHDRVSCCYWYKRPDGGVCMTCPHRQRDARIAALTAYVGGMTEG